MMLNKETELLFSIPPPRYRDKTVIYESRESGANNSLQFDRIMKSSKPSLPVLPKKLNGTACFKQKGYLDKI